MTVELKGFILAKKEVYEKDFSFTWASIEMGSYGYLTVMPFNLKFDVPADFNPVAAEISMLAAQKKKLLDDFNRSVASINERISKLQAIENVVEL